MKHIKLSLMILICAIFIWGCISSTETSKDIRKTDSNVSESDKLPSSKNKPAHPTDSFEIVGNVTYKNIEGGFYAIDGDDGKKYNPINLPEAFKKDGLKVKVTARSKKEAMSFHMYGAIIEVVNIEAK
jgi:hypothetical protein